MEHVSRIKSDSTRLKTQGLVVKRKYGVGKDALVGERSLGLSSCHKTKKDSYGSNDGDSNDSSVDSFGF